MHSKYVAAICILLQLAWVFCNKVSITDMPCSKPGDKCHFAICPGNSLPISCPLYTDELVISRMEYLPLKSHSSCDYLSNTDVMPNYEPCRFNYEVLSLTLHKETDTTKCYKSLANSILDSLKRSQLPPARQGLCKFNIDQIALSCYQLGHSATSNVAMSNSEKLKCMNLTNSAYYLSVSMMWSMGTTPSAASNPATPESILLPSSTPEQRWSTRLTSPNPIECTGETVLDSLTGKCKPLSSYKDAACQQLANQMPSVYLTEGGYCAKLPNSTSALSRAVSNITKPSVKAKMLSSFAKSQAFDDLPQVREFSLLVSRQLPTSANATGQTVEELRETIGDLLDSVAAFARGRLLTHGARDGLTGQQLAHAAGSVLTAVDAIGDGLQYAKSGFRVTKDRISVSVDKLEPGGGTRIVHSPDGQSTVKLRLFSGDGDLSGSVAMVTTVLDLPELASRLSSAPDQEIVASRVVQTTLYSNGARLDSASQPTEILLIIPHSEFLAAAKPSLIRGRLRRCVHLAWSESNSANSSASLFLSPSGCRVAPELSDDLVTACLCSHLSSFAVTFLPDTAWFSVETQRMWRQHDTPLRVLTFVCLLTSIVCLLLTNLTFLILRTQSPMSDKSIATLHRVHRSLCLALTFGHALFLAAFHPPDGIRPLACKLLSGVALFALLCAFCWLLCEGFVFTHSLVIVLPRVDSAFAQIKFGHYCIVSVVAPLTIICTIGALRSDHLIQLTADASVDNPGVQRPRVCWPSDELGTNYAFIGPAIAVCAVNLCLFAVIICRLARRNSAASAADAAEPRFQIFQRQLKVTSTLASLLGLTWLLGLAFYFVQTHAFIAVQYAFTLLNGLQGCFIFASQVCGHQRVREDCEKFLINSSRTPGPLRRLLERRRNARLSAGPSGSTPGNNKQPARKLPPPQVAQTAQPAMPHHPGDFVPFEGAEDVRYRGDFHSAPSRLSRLLNFLIGLQRLGRRRLTGGDGSTDPRQQNSTGLSDLSPPYPSVSVSNSSGYRTQKSTWHQGSAPAGASDSYQLAPLVTEDNFNSYCGRDGDGAGSNSYSTVKLPAVGLDRGNSSRITEETETRVNREDDRLLDTRDFTCATDDQSLFEATHSMAEPALRSPRSPMQHPLPPLPPIDTLPARCPGSRELLYNKAADKSLASNEYLVPTCRQGQ